MPANVFRRLFMVSSPSSVLPPPMLCTVFSMLLAVLLVLLSFKVALRVKLFWLEFKFGFVDLDRSIELPCWDIDTELDSGGCGGEVCCFVSGDKGRFGACGIDRDAATVDKMALLFRLRLASLAEEFEEDAVDVFLVVVWSLVVLWSEVDEEGGSGDGGGWLNSLFIELFDIEDWTFCELKNTKLKLFKFLSISTNSKCLVPNIHAQNYWVLPKTHTPKNKYFVFLPNPRTH